MKIKFLIFTVLIALFTQSCDDKLDILPEDGIDAKTLYETEAGAIAGIMGIYSRIHSAYRGGKFNIIYPVSGTDEAFDNRAQNQTFIENNFTSSNTDILDTWALLYEGVNAANKMLIELELSTGIEASRKKIFVAEARFARAFLFFDLQRAFGGLDGIPMPIEATVEQILPRTPGVDVYAQIIADLEFAEEHLLDITETVPGRASKSAAQGLLARVCLNRAGLPFTNDGDFYTKARDWAEKVMKNTYHELNPNYSDIFAKLATEKHETKEMLFQIGFFFENDNQQGGKVGSELGYKIDPNACYERGYSQQSPAITLIQAYRADPSDERGLWNTTPEFIKNNSTACEVAYSSNQLQYACSKYRKTLQENGKGSWGAHHWPILRLADVMLMYAEAENQLTPGSQDALDAVNDVRERAKATPLLAVTDQAIQEERRLELCWEGLRKYDLVRWGLLKQKVSGEISAMDAANGNPNPDGPGTNRVQPYYKDVYVNYIDDKHQILPIPEQEIGANPFITRNNRNW